MPSTRIAYRLARMATIMAATVWVLASAASQFVMPGLYYDEGPVPSAERRLLAFATSVAIAAFFAAPYRWTVRGVPFCVRMAGLSLISLSLAAASSYAMAGFVRGSKSWQVVPVSAAFVIVAILLPLSLVIARRIYGADITAPESAADPAPR